MLIPNLCALMFLTENGYTLPIFLAQRIYSDVFRIYSDTLKVIWKCKINIQYKANKTFKNTDYKPENTENTEI